ncbi:prion-inhibition and propagation-domain-containing protein [Xylariaceae sp. FL1019]|nr:prion-inhibition and propagation-domain-containing protein [Xylariaceae sp. FL1019]
MDVAAAALQCISFAAQAFHGCVLAIEFINTAQHMGADGDFFRVGLEFEKYRLISWGERVGLLDDNERQTLNWQLAGMILSQLESHLTSANILRDRYALSVTEEDIQVAEDTRPTATLKPVVAKLVARLKPTLYTTASRIIQENNSTIKRLRWAARDKEKLKTYLDNIAGLVDKLDCLLDSTERQQQKNEYDHLLREVVSLTSTTAEAGQMREVLENRAQHHRTEKSINAAAYLKQVRLMLGADKRHDEQIPKIDGNVGVKMPKLSILGRTLRPWNDSELFSSTLEFASYRNEQVLIQWKTVADGEWDMYTKQIKCLAVFLMSLSDKSFRSLPCVGYYPLERQGRHGIVYSMPGKGVDWDIRSLRDLISSQQRVSLNRRLQLAQALAETVLQLHTAGWLHKSIRPDNVVFLAFRGSSDDEFLKSEPYIIGYEYARSDTQDSAKAFTQLPETELWTDLYRHPQARGSNRESFQKRFDMYALACIFLELLCWRPLVNIFSSYLIPELDDIIALAQTSNTAIQLPSLDELFQRGEFVLELEHQAGKAFVEAIKTAYLTPKAKVDDEGLLTEQTAVLDKIRWCKI